MQLLPFHAASRGSRQSRFKDPEGAELGGGRPQSLSTRSRVHGTSDLRRACDINPGTHPAAPRNRHSGSARATVPRP